MPRYLALLLVLSLFAGCGGEPTPSVGPGDAANGRMLFHEGATPSCGSCHSLRPGFALLGPSLAWIGRNAGSRVPGKSAGDYLRESIVDPDAHIAFGFVANVMAAGYGAQLTEQEVEDLVAYLLTLK